MFGDETDFLLRDYMNLGSSLPHRSYMRDAFRRGIHDGLGFASCNRSDLLLRRHGLRHSDHAKDGG